MGRCQSTPGLVESKERTTVEEMWISPAPLPSTAPSCVTQQRWILAFPHSLLSSFDLLTKVFSLPVTCRTVQSHIDVRVMPIGHASPTHPARLAHLSIAQTNVHEVELLRIPLDPLTQLEMVNNFWYQRCGEEGEEEKDKVSNFQMSCEFSLN